MAGGGRAVIEYLRSHGLELAALMVLAGGAALLSLLGAMLDRSGPIRLRHWAEEGGGRLQATHR